MVTAAAYAVTSSEGAFEKTAIERRELGPLDILIEIKFAGICHSDIHTARNEWGSTRRRLRPRGRQRRAVPIRDRHGNDLTYASPS